jgi:PASTA domain
MAVRLAALLPRAVVVALIWVLGTAAFTFAADTTIVRPSTPAGPAVPAREPDLTVPSVTGQAYVFAKGILEDAGFAWRVAGSVRGYAGNRVLAQSPAAGTRVANTGAPTIVLHLVRGPYGERGTPADFSPYVGTPARLAGLAAAPVQRPTVKPAAKPKVKPRRKPSTKHVKKALKKHARKTAPTRPPAFRPAGAPKEPLDEISLPARALRLEAWAAAKPQRTDANVQHWLYQHAWIVTGAQFGWWHGDRALVTLIGVDRRIERLWGIGHRSEAVARAALAHVRRESK